MLNADIVLLQDNARPHTSRRPTVLLQEFSWEVFNHPPYSPDLAQCFPYFLTPQEILVQSTSGLQNDRETEKSVTQWFQSRTADF